MTKVNPAQQVETQAYVPTYKIKPEFHKEVLKAIGQYPFNQIQGIMQAIKVEVMDHNTLTQVINALGSFPYEKVAGLLSNVNLFIEMIQPEDVEPVVAATPEVAAPEVAAPVQA